MKALMMTIKLAALLGSLVLAPSGAAQAAAVAGQGIWERSLQARDLDGNPVNGPEAFYDTTLDITWLADANANGSMNWADANAWAGQLNLGGETGWRLPTMLDTVATGCNYSEAGGTDCGYNVQTKSGIRSKHQVGQTVYSEMAHLFYVTLDNNAFFAPGTGAINPADWGLSNTANFKNMQIGYYWTAAAYEPSNGEAAWFFQTSTGRQQFSFTNFVFNAMAVHDGDVGAVTAVPEPQSYALLLLGLLALRLRSARLAV